MGSPRVFGLLSIGGGVVDPLFLMQALCLPLSSLLAHHASSVVGKAVLGEALDFAGEERIDREPLSR
jgi:hypothetical protein